MIDIPQIIRDDLTADTAITDLTSSRVWSERTTPPKGYKPSDGAGLCVAIRGGTTPYYRFDNNISLQIKCYAADEVGAQALYRAVYDRLHFATSADARPPIFHSACEVLGQTLEEPDTDWPFVFGFFNLVIRNV